MDAPPIAGAALLLDAHGRIAAVGPAATVPHADAETLELGDAVLLPGLVNTHTHLELTGFAPTASELEFSRWILSIRRLKQARSSDGYLAAARQGVRDGWAAGITTVADTGDSGTVIQALAELGGSGIAYHEVFGPHPEQLAAALSGLAERLSGLGVFAAGRARLGVSPHAPYTVSGPLFAGVARLAAERGLPLAVHVAESEAERDFVTRGAGPFADAWRSRGIPLLDDPRHCPSAPSAPSPPSVVSWLDHHGVLTPHTLCIHAILLSGEDIALLAERGAAVAHCPVSNAAHGHADAPLAALRAAGVRVGLGTDSVASVGELDCFREARAAQQLARLSYADALALATLEGARALGLEQEIGSLTPGKWGDVIAVAPRDGLPPADPLRTVLDASPQAVRLTVLGGRIVHRAPPA